jgi:threonine/homoserine/homoserine lactone efflux protein
MWKITDKALGTFVDSHAEVQRSDFCVLCDTFIVISFAAAIPFCSSRFLSDKWTVDQRGIKIAKNGFESMYIL